VSLTAMTHALGTLIGDRWPNGTEARLVADLAARLPRVITHLADKTADGWKQSTPGAPDRATGGSGTVDAIVGIIAQRQHNAAAYADLCLAVASAAACVAEMDRPGARRALGAALRLTDMHQPPATPELRRSLRCVGGKDLVGAIEWGRADCENIAAAGRNGLCDACHMRRWRWERRQAELASAG
jgi:hypothetical protein